jgi:hypothetical protein
MWFLKQMVSRCRHGWLWVSVSLSSISLPAWADLPKPPDSDVANGNNDWIDVGGNLAYKSLRYSCMIVGAMILIGAAFGIAKAYHTSQEKQELGHFFKHGGIAVAAAAIGVGLIYAGFQILPSA